MALGELLGDNTGLIFLNHQEDETLAQWNHPNNGSDLCDLSIFDFDVNGADRNYITAQESVMGLPKSREDSPQGYAKIDGSRTSTYARGALSLLLLRLEDIEG
ncbi:hypothetical protein EG329_014247 [Mollisiaceae sp. DMI_Dod_QoI]|nr:hypothetical protein EG329_014247 [Helotiales sp. DMI_Dod_QoI]